jgi:hypothetical protein
VEEVAGVIKEFGRGKILVGGSLHTPVTRAHKTTYSSADPEPLCFAVKSDARCAITPAFDQECLFAGLQ